MSHLWRTGLFDRLDTAPLELLAEAGRLVGDGHPDLVHVQEVVLQEKLDAHAELLAIVVAVQRNFIGYDFLQKLPGLNIPYSDVVAPHKDLLVVHLLRTGIIARHGKESSL